MGTGDDVPQVMVPRIENFAGGGAGHFHRGAERGAAVGLQSRTTPSGARGGEEGGVFAVSSAAELTNFHDAGAGFQSCGDGSDLHSEFFDQHTLSAVADLYPDQPAGAVRRQGQIVKILIFAHDHPVMRAGVIPDYAILRVFHSDFPDMLRGVAGSFQKPGQRGRKMLVNEESHADWSTTWSVWCAA